MASETIKFSDIDMSFKEKDAEASLLRKQLQDSLSTSSKGKMSKLSQLITTLTLFALICTSILGFLTVKEHISSSSSGSSPSSHTAHSCGTPMARPEWRSLPEHRRYAYTVAVERLTKLPSRLGLNTSLYDDFTYVHIQVKNQVHHSALSLPWHRMFISVFEEVLKTEGRYDGVMPYWDWTIDASDPMAAPIFHPRFGFGGNGTAPSNCVTEGFLGRFTAAYQESGYSPHCVTRKFDSPHKYGDLHGEMWRAEVIKEIVMEAKTYEEFRESLESGPHKQLHLGIGGEMDSISSSNDPLFFLHHAQIDRLWWLWQQQNPEQRMHEFGGPMFENDAMFATGATLADQVSMLGMGKDHLVRDLMTTKSDVLCYKYSMDL